MEAKNILFDIDFLWKSYIEVRATFPYPRKEHIGLSIIESPSYYSNKGLKYKLEFDHVLNEQDIIRLQKLAYWINQSVLIRLYTLLEYYKILNETIQIDKSIEGNEELDILRRLRKYFVHTAIYNQNDPEQTKLFYRIIKHFELYEYDKNFFPIPIDLVIEKIFNKAKIYVNQLNISH